MARSAPRNTPERVRPYNFLYGGKFQDAMNTLYSPKNIKPTAADIKQLEIDHKVSFEVGIFNKYLLQATDLPTDVTFDSFEHDFLLIPADIRQRVTDILNANFSMEDPLPVFCKVGENLIDSHDVIIRNFLHKNKLYIGILYLCPNTNPLPD